jgi:hypothetical protein
MFRDIIGPIPNFQVGYLYRFNEFAETGRLTVDYLLPVKVGPNSMAFGEAHGAFTNFWEVFTGEPKSLEFHDYSVANEWRGSSINTELSLAGGYRKILKNKVLLGVNASFDSAWVGYEWYASGAVGLEAATLLPGNDALDLSCNWYGDLFKTEFIANAFRRGPDNYDLQVGYSHELWNGGPDLRLSATAYRYAAGTGVFGMRGGAELKSRNGMFVVKYEGAKDDLNRVYHTFGGYVNVGLQLENLLKGENPLVMPEPIFKSPRRLTKWLTEPMIPRRGTGQTNLANVSAVTDCQGYVISGRRYNGHSALYAIDLPIYPPPEGMPPFTTPRTYGSVRLTWKGIENATPNSYIYFHLYFGSTTQLRRFWTPTTIWIPTSEGSKVLTFPIEDSPIKYDSIRLWHEFFKGDRLIFPNGYFCIEPLW